MESGWPSSLFLRFPSSISFFQSLLMECESTPCSCPTLLRIRGKHVFSLGRGFHRRVSGSCCPADCSDLSD
ncbi:hypothetical protein VN97_g15 [Penicillium thymicola]|uniref:Uncharacterized protein n=1 Tax=Penicillium thymicola TaxID=293382 RepID=A0AAI9TW65_PENTH|nr:hypothetical protein VN97_g15 [Penicillium thymicola]